MTPEAKVKAQVKKILDKLGVYYFFPAANGMGRAGIPDVIGCMGGQFVAIECKAGKGKTTALQDRELDRIVDARGLAWVINELNIDKLEGYLNAYRK
jgi:Holliday junction resolvase